MFISAIVAAWLVGQSGAQAQGASYRRDIALSYRVLSAESFEQTYTHRTEITSESAISPAGRAAVSINENFVESVSLEAVNIKADGRRLVVAEEDILTTAGPNAARMSVFQADLRVRTIVFPFVEVGDVLIYTHKTRTIRPAVPGGIDERLSVPPHASYGDVLIELDAPVDMEFAVRRDAFQEEVREADGRRRYRWTLRERPFVAPERSSVAAVDYSPYVAFSNRASDAEIGRWFYAQAADAAAVTPEVALAAETVTKGLADRREQARAIHEFVTSKVRHVAVLIGQGSWTPRGANDVLATRYGDCKDHVTLMRALLAAKGIGAYYILINGGSPTYRVFDLPHTRYDHVVLYLPEFDVYADTTDTFTAFGVLPSNIAGRQMLRIGPGDIERGVTPMLKAEDDTVSIRAAIQVSEDGRYTGKTTWLMRGNAAAAVRRRFASFGLMSRAEIVSLLMKRSSLHGNGVMDAGLSTDLGEPFKVEMTFDLQNSVIQQNSDRSPIPIGPLLMEAPHLPYWRNRAEARVLDTICAPQTFEMIVDIELHASLEFGPVPAPVRVESEFGVFTASYTLDGRRLQVQRLWRLQPTSMSCSQDILRSKIMPIVNAMSRDSAAFLAVKRSGAQAKGH